MSLVAALRARLDTVIFTKVAGPDGFETRERIHSTPGPRWFPPGSAIRRVHDDPAMYPGGIRALLLQSLHPLAMAAVAQHSGYRSDVWGRLARTSTFLATTTFGTAEHAQQAVDVVRAVHARVSGTAPDGRAYRAADPHLLAWVHVAEVDSFLTAYGAFGRERLTPARQDAYVAQTAVVARALGAAGVPTTTAQLASAVEAYRAELVATPQALDVARFLVREPPLPRVVRPLYAILAASAVDLLPPWARELLGLPHRGRLARGAVRVGARLVLAAMGWVAASSRRPGTADPRPADPRPADPRPAAGRPGAAERDARPHNAAPTPAGQEGRRAEAGQAVPDTVPAPRAARPASSRATGTRQGEQET